MIYLVLSVVVLGVIWYVEKLLSKVKHYSLKSSFKNNFSLIKLVCISVLFASIMCFVSVLLENASIFDASHGEFELSSLPYILFSISIIPLAEEFFYRFTPYEIFNNPGFINYIIVASSLLFSLCHNASNYEHVFIFVMALGLSYIYIKTRNISYNMGAHGVYNLFVFLEFYNVFDNLVVLAVLILISASVLIMYKKKVIKRKP